MSKRFIIILLCVFLVLLQSCFKTEDYPPEPSVEVISFTLIEGIDTLGNRLLKGVLHFSFVDGDGDIGFDTVSPIRHTIFLEKYMLQNGEEIKVDMQLPQNYYVPKFTTSGNNKTLKGEMIVRDLNEFPPFSGDTIFYKFYIVDRSGNKSNVENSGYAMLR